MELMCVGVEDGGIGMELCVEDVGGDVEEDGAGVCFVKAVVGDFGKVFFCCVRLDGSKSSLSMSSDI